MTKQELDDEEDEFIEQTKLLLERVASLRERLDAAPDSEERRESERALLVKIEAAYRAMIAMSEAGLIHTAEGRAEMYARTVALYERVAEAAPTTIEETRGDAGNA